MAGIWTLFEESVDTGNLNQLFEEHWRSSRVPGVDGLSGVHLDAHRDVLESEIEIIRKKIQRKEYNFSRYKARLITKGAGKNPRVISIPTVRDRLVLKCINDSLFKKYQKYQPELPQTVIKKIFRSIRDCRYNAFVKFDFKDFYPSIDHGVLKSNLRLFIRSKRMVSILLEAVKTETVGVPTSEEKGVPQGIAISNFLGEVIGNRFQKTLSQQLRKRRIPIDCFRYVDDSLILCNREDIEVIKQLIQTESRKMCLKIHEFSGRETSKSYSGSLDEGFEFLGYKFDERVVSVRENSIQRLQNSLARVCTKGKYQIQKNKNKDDLERILGRRNWFLDLTISGCLFMGRRRGWLAYYSQITDLGLLRRLDAKVVQLKRRFGITGEIKTFIDSYRELHKEPRKWKYIPNFDQFSIADKRNFLNKYFPEKTVLEQDRYVKLKDAQDTTVESYFEHLIYHTVKTLEEDILVIS